MYMHNYVQYVKFIVLVRMTREKTSFCIIICLTSRTYFFLNFMTINGTMNNI